MLTENHHLETSNQDVDASLNALPMTVLHSTNASDQTADQLTSPEPTSIEGHDDTEDVYETYEDIDLNTDTTLSTSVGVNAYLTLLSGDSSGEGSIAEVIDSSSDSNSSKKRSRYEELLERSPIVKRIYLRLKRSQKAQETQMTNSSAFSKENVTESPVYTNSLQAKTTK